MASELEILRTARGLIDSPEKWIRGAYCRIGSFETNNVFSPCADCFCSLGAIYRAIGRFDDDAATAAARLVLEAAGER